MASSIAIPAYGTLLKIGDGGSPENFTIVAEVKDISGPKMKADTAETTTHSPGGVAPTSAWKEYLATLLEAGDVTFKVNFVPTNATFPLNSSCSATAACAFMSDSARGCFSSGPVIPVSAITNGNFGAPRSLRTSRMKCAM